MALEHAFSARFQWFKPVLLGAILAIDALIAPLAVPILTPDKLVETRRHNYQSFSPMISILMDAAVDLGAASVSDSIAG